jgi:hypothetical protein
MDLNAEQLPSAAAASWVPSAQPYPTQTPLFHETVAANEPYNETKMSKKAIVGVYDSQAKAERAELLLEEAYLPVGQISLIVPRMEAGEVEGDITARGMAAAVADTGVRLGAAQIDECERMLQEGKSLLIFYGDADQVAQAYQALEHTDNYELTMLEGRAHLLVEKVHTIGHCQRAVLKIGDHLILLAATLMLLGIALFRGSAPFWATWLPKIRRWR